MPQANYIDVLVRMLNAAKYEADAKRMSRATEQIGTSAEKTAKGMQGAAASMRNLSRAAGGFYAVRLMFGALADATNAASNFAEQTNKVNVVFGGSAGLVRNFADTAQSIGFARDEALAAVGTFGGLFTGLGVAQGKAADMSVSLTKLAADLASFNNVPTADAFQALRAGLVGETEPLRRLNIQLSDQILRQRAMAMGLTTTTSKVLLPAQRTLAAYAEIMAQAGVQHGDFSRTATQLANSQRQLSAEWRNAQIEIGNDLIPAVRDLVHGFSTLLRVMQPLLQNRTLVTVMLAEFAAGMIALGVAATIAAIAFTGLDIAAAPWIILAAAIIAGVVLLVTHFDDLKQNVVILVAVAFGPLGIVVGGLILLFQHLGDIMDWVVKKVAGGVSKLRAPIHFIGHEVGQLTGALGGLSVPGFAVGTGFAPGGLAMVGERGPELVNLPRGSQVIPLNSGGSANGAAQPTPPIEVTVVSVLDGQVIARSVAKTWEDGGARR